jgi:protein farnesyltransferase subunit beta
VLTSHSGAYIAAVVISLLDLPLNLSRDSPAWSHEGDTLITGLPEWIARSSVPFTRN